MNEFGHILHRLLLPFTYPAALATLIRVRGSSYRRSGARLLVDRQEKKIGSISGGCLEEDLLTRIARGLGSFPPPETITYDTTSENDLVWGVGLGCHGIVHVVVEWLPSQPAWVEAVHAPWRRRQPVELWIDEEGTRTPAITGEPAGPGVFVDRIQPPLALTVFGAGDDAQPLVRLAATLGWTVTVLDPRPAFATPARFPEASAVVAAPIQELVAQVPWDDRTAAVVMTHHYLFDRPVLAALLPLGLPYLGLLGPRRRADKILADLRTNDRSFAADAEARLHAPVGLDLGGDGPEAVALAILAEIQATMIGRDAQPLRHRQKPIHSD